MAAKRDDLGPNVPRNGPISPRNGQIYLIFKIFQNYTSIARSKNLEQGNLLSQIAPFLIYLQHDPPLFRCLTASAQLSYIWYAVYVSFVKYWHGWPWCMVHGAWCVVRAFVAVFVYVYVRVNCGRSLGASVAFIQDRTPGSGHGAFYTYLYNHAHRPHLEKAIMPRAF